MEPTEERLVALGSATLGESGARTTAPRLRQVWPSNPIAAQAYTVKCAPADNLAIHLGVTLAPKASLLVVDASDEPERGYWGEVLTTAAQTRHLAGLVIDGCVRDVAALEAHRFPVYSAGIALRGADKTVGGEVGGTISLAGAEVSTGDWIVGDRDGVVVVPAREVDAVLAAADARALKEQGLFRLLKSGSTTIELLALDPSPVVRHDG